MTPGQRAEIVHRATCGLAFPSDVLALDAELTRVEDKIMGQGAWRPDWTVPPGETLLELLDLRGWTQAELARQVGRSLKHVNCVIHGHEKINVKLALALEAIDMGSAEFWMHREVDHQIQLRRIKETL